MPGHFLHRGNICRPLKLGLAGNIDYGRKLQRRISPPPKWMREVVAELGAANLTAPQGVPMQKLSEGLQSKLRATVVEHHSLQLLKLYQSLFFSPEIEPLIKALVIHNQRPLNFAGPDR